ncbi:F-box/LRR-repeat protein [Abeliophyllum distichum]|uniref:F-box/LRR-repeat protein n=1 Tax=Abeliophyllum distichum TaxID=126358 RepID=A0ABD1QXG8_9LAMI
MVNGIHIYDMHYRNRNVVDHVGEKNRSRCPGNEEVSDSNVNQGVDEEKEEERIMEKCVPWFPSQPQKKRLKRVMVDRISALHDSVLLHILSFLNMQEAVCTSVLSKRWKSLWTSLSTVTFHNRRCLPEKSRPFVERVTRILENYRAGNMKKFAVDFMYNSRYASHVDYWILLAVQNKVEDLDLRFHFCSQIAVDQDVVEPHTLPHHVYFAPTLTSLSLLNCILGLNGAVAWRSLKSLSITQVDLTEDAFEVILSGSPVLEYLKINACRGMNHIDINSASVKTLVIQNCEAEWLDTLLLEISAPYIQSLHILGTTYGRVFRLINVSSLVTANLNYYSDALCHYTKLLLESLHHVKEINLGPYCIQILSMLEMLGWPSPPTSWKSLVLNAHLDEVDTPGILRLLLNSPSIETLIINKTRVGCSDLLLDSDVPDGGVICGISLVTGIMLPHLKTVKFAGYTGVGGLGAPTLELILFLLENANTLEKIIIVVSPGTDYRQDAQILLSLPRSSPHVEIIFRRRILY